MKTDHSHKVDAAEVQGVEGIRQQVPWVCAGVICIALLFTVLCCFFTGKSDAGSHGELRGGAPFGSYSVDTAPHAKGEMIRNPVLLASFQSIVDRPGRHSFIVALVLVVGCCLANSYNTLKNEPLTLPPFDTKLKDVHQSLENDFSSGLRDYTYGTVLVWSNETDADIAQGVWEGSSLNSVIQEVATKLQALKQRDSSCKTLSWDSYAPHMPPFQEQDYLSADRSAAVIQLALKQYATESVTVLNKCFANIRAELADVNGKFGGLNVAMSSTNAVVDASLSASQWEADMHMLMSAPFMIALLMLGVGTLPRAMTPFACLGASLVCMRASLVLIKWCWRDLNFALPDTITTFTMLALSFDYGLFFWMRFASERQKFPHHSMQKAVMTTLTTSGYVILLSMSVLVTAFIVGSFYPNLNELGYLAANLQLIIGTVSIGVFSLVIPAILILQFPSIFDEPSTDGLYSISGFVKEHVTVRPWSLRVAGKFVTQQPWVYLVPLCIFMCMIPPIHYLAALDLSYDSYELYASKETLEFNANKVYSDRFQKSGQSSAIIHLEAIPLDMFGQPMLLQGNTVAELERKPTLTHTFGELACRFAQLMVEETNGEAYSILSEDISGLWWNGQSSECLANAVLGPLTSTLLSVDGYKQLMMVHTEATGSDAEHMINKFWDVIEPKADWIFQADNTQYRFRASFYTPVAEDILVERKDRESAPWNIGITVVCVGCLVGFAFGSAFLTVKLVFTVFVPILAEFGLLVFIYTSGWGHYIGIETVPGIPWSLLYCTPYLLFALAMDFDLFLFAKVYELRMEGYDNTSAVRIALEETGPAIQLAGSMMIVAFFAVFLSSVPIVSQTGLLYCIGVAVDTYIVRMWIAPAVLCMFERTNYWPAELPPGVKDYHYYDKMSSKDGPDILGEA
jgi:predicted RND superfamily exporter protein